MKKNRNWTVLIIGGASGTGKSSIAYQLGEFYGVNVLEVDNIHLSVKAVTNAEEFPAIHYWSSGIDWRDIGAEGNVSWLLGVGKEMSPIIEKLVNRHIEDNVPIIIEGDFINPDFVKSFDNQKVESIFINESDMNQIVNNYLSREGGNTQEYRAEISVKYGKALMTECEKHNIKFVDSRPWNTALERIYQIINNQ